MALSSVRGRFSGRFMRQPLNGHELRGHLQKLRQIFGMRFESKYGENFEPRSIQTAGPGVCFVLQENSSTVNVTNDLHEKEVCAVLATVGQKRFLCSFFESWKMIRPRNPQYRFNQANLKFFLGVGAGREPLQKQIFRLEWDNWQDHDPPNKAAYPHWQFDRWLTASDGDRDDVLELRESFKASDDKPMIFESAEQQGVERPIRAERPDLGWFTRIHFPSNAPWAIEPIKSLDDAREPQPHRTIPNCVTELEGWIDSALRYLKNELETYG